MGAGPLVLELFLVFVLTLVLLHKYGNWRKQHLIVTVSTFVGWYFSFIIIFILPLDVSLTFFNKCLKENSKNSTTTVVPPSDPTEGGVVTQVSEDANGSATSSTPTVIVDCEVPGSFVHDQVLLSLWRVVYWSAQLLTWIVLPLMQSYSQAGEFTALGKLRTAVYNNAIYYGSYMLIFGILLMYAAAKGVSLTAENLKVLLVTASNTWGLFLLVLLLGYGLVEVPRQMWQMGSKGYRLNKTYFDIEKLSADKNDAEEVLKEVYRDAQEACNALRDSHPFRIHAETILAKFPPDVRAMLDESAARRTRTVGGTMSDTDAANVSISSEKYLVRLHKRVIDALQGHQRTQAQWRALIQLALHLEEVAKNENNPQPHFMRTYRVDRSIFHQTFCTPTIEYYWEVVMKRPLLQVLGGFLWVMTLVIVWSECTFFLVRPSLSIAAAIVHTASDGYHYKYIQLCAMIVISYLCVCAYYTVFKLRIYRYYHLDPHHQTDENSLLFSAILLCRLTPPLCLNFLGMIHLDSHVSNDANSGAETQFTKLMGHLDVLPLVAKGINIYLPMLILLLCLGTWFRVGTRLLHSLGIDQFVGDDDMTTEMVQGGKALVSFERNRINREVNREQRDQYWAEKLQDSSRARRGNGGNSSDGGASDSRLSMGREYSDREPIIGDQDDERVGDPFRSAARSYGSPGHPPKNLFDDL